LGIGKQPLGLYRRTELRFDLAQGPPKITHTSNPTQGRNTPSNTIATTHNSIQNLITPLSPPPRPLRHWQKRVWVGFVATLGSKKKMPRQPGDQNKHAKILLSNSATALSPQLTVENMLLT